MAGFFPLFFKAYWADPGDPARSTFYLGVANSAASMVIVLLAPLLGAMADRGTAKKKFLVTFAFLGAAMTGGLYLVGQGHSKAAVLVYVMATIGFSGSNIFYDSLLPGISSKKKMDYVSSLGFSMGYLGGGLLFAANVLMYTKPGLFGISDPATAVKISFLTVAVWWVLFTIPLILYVNEPRFHEEVPFSEIAVHGFRQLAGTLGQLRHYKVVGLFLLSYWFYIDGVDTIVKMAVDFGLSLGFPSQSLIVALLLVQFVAFPSALAYSLFASKIGTKEAILVAIAAYSAITVMAYFIQTVAHFYALAIGIGLFQGGIQALSRSLYTQIIPKEKSAEFFGFYNMLGKFAAVIGPTMMGTVTLVTGNPRLGILSIVVLLGTGGILLLNVDIEKGKSMASSTLPL